MPSPGEPSLSLSEWLVLCLITEQATHGNAHLGGDRVPRRALCGPAVSAAQS
jgi:hypothetical protein